MYCHTDYEEMSEDHICQQKHDGGRPTVCTGECSLKYQPNTNTIEGKLDYIIQLLEKDALRKRIDRINPS